MTTTEPADAILTRNLTRNFVLNVLDGTAFIFGVSLISRYTVLPLFVSQLSDERWLQGLIPALTYTGWFLPALFMAPFVASVPRRKPLILTATIGERLPYLLLGLLLLSGPPCPPQRCWSCSSYSTQPTPSAAESR
jgi:hypothetical protein